MVYGGDEEISVVVVASCSITEIWRRAGYDMDAPMDSVFQRDDCSCEENASGKPKPRALYSLGTLPLPCLRTIKVKTAFLFRSRDDERNHNQIDQLASSFAKRQSIDMNVSEMTWVNV